ncbi:MAG: RNA polymerase sigma factor [Candidatus Acidiferrales bacterium]
MNQENQSMPAPSCDAELIARAQQGEESAFEALYHAHKRRVYHLCFRMIGNTAEAEELTQEAFLRVFRKIHTFRGDSAFSTWLHRLSVNVVLMRLRKKTVQETTFESSDESEASERPSREFGAPDLSLTGLIDRLALKRAVAKLSPGCKQVFMLHDVLGCEHHEIAAMMGYSIGNSKSQLHKARMRLRALLRTGSRKSACRRKRPSAAGLVQSLRNLRSACAAALPVRTSVLDGDL